MASHSDQVKRLLADVTQKAQSRGCSLAIGVDMAANEDQWGICVLAVSRELDCADLTLLLPQAKQNKNNSLSPTLICRPSLDILRTVLESVANSKIKASMGVDVPFGWPDQHSRFVNAWSARDAWQNEEPLPSRSDFEKRLTDIELNKFDPSISPFAVGGDKIAQAAYKWARCRCDLSTIGGGVDFGLDEGNASKVPGLISFESYPGAFVNLIYPQHSSYKSKPDVRRKLLATLQADYRFSCVNEKRSCLDWAIEQKGSPDAFDALLCAITAWGHLRWQSGNNQHPMTTPGLLLGTPVAEATKARIRREGWILVPSPLSNRPTPYENGTTATTQIGYVNKNNQRCGGTMWDRSASNPDLYIYKMTCEDCGCVYGANGCDVWLRKCPDCQGGKPGEHC